MKNFYKLLIILIRRLLNIMEIFFYSKKKICFNMPLDNIFYFFKRQITLYIILKAMKIKDSDKVLHIRMVENREVEKIFRDNRRKREKAED